MKPSESISRKFKKLHEKIIIFEKNCNEQSLQSFDVDKIPPEGINKLRMTLNDIQNGIQSSPYRVLVNQQQQPLFALTEPPKTEENVSPYIKIILRKSEEILLYEQRSETVFQDSVEAEEVIRDNERYEKQFHKTGRACKMIESETQTKEIMMKSRDMNTDSIKAQPVGCYVSNFEMFDTYKDLEQSTKSVNVNGKQEMKITTYTVDGVDKFVEINELPNFKLALMLVMRVLAGNVYEPQQRRFRNMQLPDPLALEVCYKYRLNLLWRFVPEAQNQIQAVADMSWCPKLGDVLAVAYGIYSRATNMNNANNGCVRIWSIKNPVNSERFYTFSAAVTSVEFSPFLPQLLAVGLFDGHVHIINISSNNESPIASTQNNVWSTFEPITAIKWLPKSVGERFHIEQFLAVSQSGSVIKYRIINSPHLLGFQHVALDRANGCNIEGLTVPNVTEHVHANRHPQGLGITLDPIDQNTFHVLTDEGCLHKCSINYPLQTLSKLRVAEGAINSMDYSPWSPKLYLTCGNDWCIRIWMVGIFEPLITLSGKNTPIHCGAWSKTHATIIVTLNRKTIDIWDIQHNILKPIVSTTIDKSHHTLFKFSNCGRSIAVGNEAGQVLMLALDDLPFPPKYQYEFLRKALFKAVKSDKVLTAKLRSVGYFGFTNNK